MPILLRTLHHQVLRAGPTMLVGAALGALRERPDPAAWLLIFPGAGGYVVVSPDDLARRLRDDPQLLGRQLATLAIPTSVAIELDTPQAEAQRLLAQAASGYLVVLRDDQPYGVLRRPHLALSDPGLPALLDRAAQLPAPTPATLSDDAPLTRGLERPAPQPRLEPVQRRTDRYVNTDFAGDDTPDRPLDKRQPLQQGRWYFLRVHIGELEAASIEATPTLVPDLVLQQDADIRVVIFSEEFELAEETGVLRVPTDGPATVAAPASVPAGRAPDDALLRERLLFRVRVPGGRRGLCELRVNMYCHGMLIQSRLVSARVGAGKPLNERGAQLVSVLEYNLSPALAPSHLGAVAQHTLSIMLNSDSQGNQSFRLLGQEGQELFTNSATLDAGAVNDLITQARGALQRAAWGFDAEWDGKAAYRYEPGTAAAKLAGQLAKDLGDLAAAGARIYAAIKNSLGGGRPGADKLRELMRKPGVVQLAGKISANDVVPIALMYDYKIDSQNIQGLCPQFEQSLAKVQQGGGSLADEPCFQGACPSRDSLSLVCPSGFWGFRHDIGVPTPTPNGPPVALTISYTGQPLIELATYTDFPQIKPHMEWFGRLGASVQRQSDRAEVIKMFTSTQPQVVYFYCHGVLQDTRPSLKIGSGASPGYLTIDNWSNLDIYWPEARPLMFINGCHTTAISPSQALNLVKVLIEDVAAAGVIGTEITIFEPLAQAFAQTMLPLFLQGVPLGRAVRLARLALLAQHNPLGLVYTPHAYAELRMTQG